MNYIVVDEFDNVVGYYKSEQDAVENASCEYENGERSTYVYKITPVASFEEKT